MTGGGQIMTRGDAMARARRQARPFGWIVEQARHRRRKGGGIADRRQQAGDPVGDHGRHALDAVSLTVREGEIVGVRHASTLPAPGTSADGPVNRLRCSHVLESAAAAID